MALRAVPLVSQPSPVLARASAATQFGHQGPQPLGRGPRLYSAAASAVLPPQRCCRLSGAAASAPQLLSPLPTTMQVLGGDIETMELLASHPKVDIHALNKFGCAAVQWAAAAGNVSTCRWLVSKGVSFEHVNHVRHGALNKAAVKGHVDAVRWLLYAEDGPKLTDQLLLLDLEGRTVADLCYLMRQDAVGAWLDELITTHRHAEVEVKKGGAT